MSHGSFFNKVISYLAEVNKGQHKRLLDDGWISVEEANKINVILLSLGFIKNDSGNISVTQKGLKVLLNQKLGKLSDVYNNDVLELLLLSTSTGNSNEHTVEIP